ncbi:hypothetical protein H4F05_05530 [Vibrio cholerae]
MAAQKLTRGRFAQIIIMLTLLLTAFFWRTITHTDAIEVVCELKPACTFVVENDRFTAKFEANEIIITKPNTKWLLKSLESPQTITESDTDWRLEPPVYEALSLSLQDLNKTKEATIKFRM